jgi:ankyrin repeat protein
MHHAAAQGHVDLMKMLLENGASIDARNKNLETPLLVATRKVSEVIHTESHKYCVGS